MQAKIHVHDAAALHRAAVAVARDRGIRPADYRLMRLDDPIRTDLRMVLEGAAPGIEVELDDEEPLSWAA